MFTDRLVSLDKLAWTQAHTQHTHTRTCAHTHTHTHHTHTHTHTSDDIPSDEEDDRDQDHHYDHHHHHHSNEDYRCFRNTLRRRHLQGAHSYSTHKIIPDRIPSLASMNTKSSRAPNSNDYPAAPCTVCLHTVEPLYKGHSERRTPL